jgi:hypothetical protein
MSLDHQLPLAADLWDAIVPLIVMVLWALGQLMGGGKPKPKAPPRVPQAPPGQPVAPLPPGGRQPTLEETLRREVEQFKRRAEGRTAGAPQRQQPASAKRDPRTVRTAADRPVRRLADTSRPAIAPAVSGPLAPEPPRTAPTGASVGQHVAEHLRGAREMAAHVQQLGADVAQADERLQEHLQEKFTHQVGALEHRTEAVRAGAVRSPMAQDLLKLMAQPGGVRQVIVASEILRRPEERWSRRVDDA